MVPPVFFTLRLRQLRLLAISIFALGIIALSAMQKAYAPGSDASFPLAGRIVVIDPGHGGIDPGCHLGDITEKEISLAVGRLLAEELESQGSSVHITRTADVELSPYGRTQRTRHGRDLEARVLLAESYEGEIFVSLHVNAAASERMGGGMVFYHKSSEEGRLLAQAILTHLKEVTPGNQNAVLPADFYVLRHSRMPAVLVEMGFLTHRTDRELLQSQDGKRRIAQAIAQGIADYLAGGATIAEEALASLDSPRPASLIGLTSDGAHDCPIPPQGIAGRDDRLPAKREDIQA